MKKNYVTPEMEEFKFEMPQLFGDDDEAEGGEEGIGGSGTPGDDAA
jgi:hypothetical protein